MWKGKYHGQDVAVKVIRTPSSTDLQSLQKIMGVGCTIFLRVNMLIEPRIEVLQGSRNVGIASASKCTATDRSDDD